MPSWDAEDYHRHSANQQAWARELFGKLDLRGDERVLDIGCGDGKVTAELAARLRDGRVLGIDSSEAMVRFAREAFPPERHPQLRFAHVDAREMRFGEEFDLVFSNATLHWVVDHGPVLAGIARALVPGGRALLQMAGRGNAATVVEVMAAVIAEPGWHAHFVGFRFPYGFYAPEDYRPWLDQAGLAPLRVDLLSKDMVHAGADGLAGWIRTTWLPYLERVPPSRRDELVGAVVRRYLDRHPADAEGRIHVQMQRLEVEAIRPPVTGRSCSPA
jgi:trans-aconitate 2-methyltransferase